VSQDKTLEEVARMIREVIGEDWELDQPITRETSFAEDLELESIEFVALAEKLQTTYGARLDFVPWLSSKELDEIIALKVGDVVEYIERCLRSEPTA
jgi:acyl carrier protein